MTLSERLAAKGYGPDMQPLADDVVDLRDDRGGAAVSGDKDWNLDAIARHLLERRREDCYCEPYRKPCVECGVYHDGLLDMAEVIEGRATPEELAVFRKAQEAQ